MYRAHHLSFRGHVLKANGEMPERLKGIVRVGLEILVVIS